MLSDLDLKNILASNVLKQQKDKVLAILAFDNNSPKKVTRIIKIATNAGLREIKNWNVSRALSLARGLAILTPQGWELTENGKAYIRKVLPSTPAVSAVANSLRAYLKTISNRNYCAFIEDAIKCYEYKLYKPAIVFSWAGAVSILQHYVLANKVHEFNAEGLRRDPKFKAIKTIDDFGKIKEYDFLNLLENIHVLGKNTKQLLQSTYLVNRNTCGHPNSTQIGENVVTAHIEFLMQNVYSKFT